MIDFDLDRDGLLELVERSKSLHQRPRLHRCRLTGVDFFRVDLAQFDIGAVEFNRCAFDGCVLPGDGDFLTVNALADVSFINCDLHAVRINRFKPGIESETDRWYELAALIKAGRINATGCRLPPSAPIPPTGEIEYVNRQPVERVADPMSAA